MAPYKEIVFLFGFAFTPLVVAFNFHDSATIRTPWGRIRGHESFTDGGHPYLSFLGIPFAKPPVGDLRFAKPVPSDPQQRGTIYDATKMKPSCWSYAVLPEDSSEDCLFLDVYVPSLDIRRRKPRSVMVYLHHGGFVLYPDDMNFHALMARSDNIIVLVHYRLSAFGFLSTGDDGLKGNYGLWDQNMALQWVKKNIVGFGGDPNSITMFGMSAGGAAVGHQALALPSKDLYDRAILISGAATSSWALERDPAPSAFRLGEILGCSSTDAEGQPVPIESFIICMRQVPAEKLQTALLQFYATAPLPQALTEFYFVPTIDGEFVLDDPHVLLKDQSHLEALGIPKKDFIIGTVNNDGGYVALNPLNPPAPDFASFFETTLIPFVMEQRYGTQVPDEANKAVYDFYVKDEPTDTLNIFKVKDAMGDALFAMPIFETAMSFANVQPPCKGGKTYVYVFDYCPSFSPVFCMVHGFDGFYFLNSAMIEDDTDRLLTEMYIDFFSTFARTGVPISENTGEVTWAPFNKKTDYNVLKLCPNPENRLDFWLDRRQLWLNDIPKLLE